MHSFRELGTEARADVELSDSLRDDDRVRPGYYSQRPGPYLVCARLFISGRGICIILAVADERRGTPFTSLSFRDLRRVFCFSKFSFQSATPHNETFPVDK